MRSKAPIRILTAVPLCDGHDSAITTINQQLIHAGIEVIYLGYHRSARDIARAAVQEAVHAVGISSYNGGHVEFFAEVRKHLKSRGGSDIGLFGGGGGTITPADARRMRRRGVDRIFFPGESLDSIVEFVRSRYRRAPRGPIGLPRSDGYISKSITNASKMTMRSTPIAPRVIAFTGPGGAGKTTLIDELVLRHLSHHPKSRVAILSHDPSVSGRGAMLGDRAMMIYSQDDRVFMHSLATHGQAGGLSPQTKHALRVLKSCAFDVIFIETVGIGQEAAPFKPGEVDRSVLVMSPDYGAQLQLQKIMMLDLADVVVVNKSDRPGAKSAAVEIGHRIHGRPLIVTTAKRHGDSGVDELYRLLHPLGEGRGEGLRDSAGLGKSEQSLTPTLSRRERGQDAGGRR